MAFVSRCDCPRFRNLLIQMFASRAGGTLCHVINNAKQTITKRWRTAQGRKKADQLAGRWEYREGISCRLSPHQTFIGACHTHAGKFSWKVSPPPPKDGNRRLRKNSKIQY
jgi:hypothetical protein